MEVEKRDAMHPLARWVAGLSSPMSLQDQRLGVSMVTRILYLCLFLSLLVGYLLEDIYMLFYGQAVGCALSLIFFVPNWYQRGDTDQRWCDEEVVKEYYAVRQKLLDEIAETDGKEDVQREDEEEGEEEDHEDDKGRKKQRGKDE